MYPQGIPIYPEDQLSQLIRQHNVDLVSFSYSDLPHVEVMHKASLVTAEDASLKTSVGDKENCVCPKSGGL